MNAIGGDGFEDFVHAEIPRLLRLARVLTRNGHDAADLVQDTLIRVGLKWSSIRKDGNPHGYARTTLIRAHLNTGRRARREILTSTVPERSVDDASPEFADRAWLVGALDALPPRQRAAIVLRYVEDLTVAQIAEALGCAEGTAKSQLSRALAALRITQDDPRQTTPMDGDSHAN